MVAAGTALKASFVGANTVNGPPDCSVADRPPWATKLLNVLSDGLRAKLSDRFAAVGLVAQAPSVSAMAANKVVRRSVLNGLEAVMVRFVGWLRAAKHKNLG